MAYNIKRKTEIVIGHEGEKCFSEVHFDVSDLPEGVLYLEHLRCGDKYAYPIRLERVGDEAVWIPNETDTAKRGTGKGQLVVYVGDEIVAKSDVFKLINRYSLATTAEVPDGYDSWIQRLETLGADIEGKTTDGLNAINEARDSALDRISTVSADGIKAVNEAKTQGVSAVNSAKTQGIDAVNTAKTQGINAVNSAKTDSLDAIERKKDAVHTELDGYVAEHHDELKGEGVTDEDKQRIAAEVEALYTAELGEVKKDLSSLTDVVEYQNAKLKTTEHIPFFIKSGTSITIRSVDGQTLPSNRLNVYDENNVYIDYFTINDTYGEERIVNYTKKDAHYIALNTNSARDVKVIAPDGNSLIEKVAKAEDDIDVLYAKSDATNKEIEYFEESFSTGIKKVSLNWERGWITSSGQYQDYPYRFRITDFIRVTEKMVAHCDTGFYGYVEYFDESGKIQTYRQIPQGENYNVSTSYAKIKLVVMKPNDAPMTIEETSAVTLRINHNEVYERLNRVDAKVSERFVEEMNSTIASVRECITEPSLVFPRFTDLHYSETSSVFQNAEEMFANIKYMSRYIPFDFVADTGDDINGRSDVPRSLGEAYNVHTMMRNVGKPVVFTMGNHDTNYDPSPKFSISQVYGAFYSDTQKDVVVNKASNGTDFYVDYNDLGIRVVSLNTQYNGSNFISDASANWFANTVLDTDNIILLLTHVSPIGTQNVYGTTPYNGDWLTNKINEFILGGHTLVQLFGHSHADYSFTTPWLSIASTCGKFEKSDVTTSPWQAITGYDSTYGLVSPDRTVGTATEQAWDVVIVRPTTRKINVIRFGAGVDREFDF